MNQADQAGMVRLTLMMVNKVLVGISKVKLERFKIPRQKVKKPSEDQSSVRERVHHHQPIKMAAFDFLLPNLRIPMPHLRKIERPIEQTRNISKYYRNLKTHLMKILILNKKRT